MRWLAQARHNNEGKEVTKNCVLGTQRHPRTLFCPLARSISPCRPQKAAILATTAPGRWRSTMPYAGLCNNTI